jgi:hypothetical protein
VRTADISTLIAISNVIMAGKILDFASGLKKITANFLDIISSREYSKVVITGGG